jgi:hypothetical protein
LKFIFLCILIKSITFSYIPEFSNLENAVREEGGDRGPE